MHATFRSKLVTLVSLDPFYVSNRFSQGRDVNTVNPFTKATYVFQEITHIQLGIGYLCNLNTKQNI